MQDSQTLNNRIRAEKAAATVREALGALKMKWTDLPSAPYFNFPLQTDVVIPFNTLVHNESLVPTFAPDTSSGKFTILRDGIYGISAKLHFFDFGEDRTLLMKLFREGRYADELAALLYKRPVTGLITNTIFLGQTQLSAKAGEVYKVSVEILAPEGVSPYPADVDNSPCELNVAKVI